MCYRRVFILLALLLLAGCGQPGGISEEVPPATVAAVAAAPVAPSATQASIGAVPSGTPGGALSGTPGTPTRPATRAATPQGTPTNARATPPSPAATVPRTPLASPTSTVAMGTPSARATATPAVSTPSAEELAKLFPTGFVDQAQGRFLLASLTEGEPGYGAVLVGISGQGLFALSDRAQVAREADGTITLAYSGPASLYADTKLDPPILALLQVSGPETKTIVQLSARLDPVAHTGDVTLTRDGATYTLRCVTPPRDADAMFAAFIAAANAGDAATMYRLSDHHWHATMTEAEYVAWIAAEPSAQIRALGPLAYSVDLDGQQYATSSVAVSITKDGATETTDEPIIFVYERDAWRFVTTSPPK